MLVSFAQLAIRRRRVVLVVTLLVAIFAGAFGTTVFGRMYDGGMSAPNSEAMRGYEFLSRQPGFEMPNYMLLVDGGQASVDSPAVAEKGRALTASLAAEPGVHNVVSYWTAPDIPEFRSKNGHHALIFATVKAPGVPVLEASARLTEKYATSEGAGTRDGQSIRVLAGGDLEINRQVNEQVESDLARAEMVSLPLILLALILIFGGVVAASLPLAIGGLAVLGTFLTLRLLTEVVEVSIFSLNLTTMLGLGLGVDYSLFIISRYREELRRGLSTNDAIVKAIRTGGRTVLFSAVVVAISLSALLVFPMYMLRSFAYAGVSVVAIAALASILVLPALLAVLGPRIDRWRILQRPTPEEGSPFWAAVARLVMRRPIVITVVTITVLLISASPFLGVNWGSLDDRTLPVSATSRQVADTIRTEFSANESSTISVALPTIDVERSGDAIDAYATDLSKLDGVLRVAAPRGTYVDGRVEPGASPWNASLQQGAVLQLTAAGEPISAQGRQLVEAVRAIPAPSERLVSGPAAFSLDDNQQIIDRVPLAGALIAIATLVVLFLMTGSAVLPVKAVVMGALSLTATFGFMVWVFQDGHLSSMLNFTAVGSLDMTNPIIMFCIAFGLSMDYEVFLLSRIKEAHDETGNTSTAIATGLARSGRVVTAAAVLLALVFLAFATSEVAMIKLIGLGLAIAILVDATIIRGLLVPALMKLMGEANWWAPTGLKRLHRRLGISEATQAMEPAYQVKS